MRPDYVAGNTRLRARIAPLAAVADLAPGEREPVVQELLRDVPGAYQAPARSVVDVLVARQDVRDVLALLRGAIRGRPAEERRRAVRAVGRVTNAAAAEAADGADGADAVSRLVRLELPEPALTPALRAAWEAYALHEDVDELETEVSSAAYAHWGAFLARAGRGARPVAALLAHELDAANLVTVLRIGALDRVRLLPQARLGDDALAAATLGDWGPVGLARPGWLLALRPLGPRPGPAEVADRLRTALASSALARLRRGDQLTADPAVGYVLAVEDAARRAPTDPGPPASVPLDLSPTSKEDWWVHSS